MKGWDGKSAQETIAKYSAKGKIREIKGKRPKEDKDKSDKPKRGKYNNKICFDTNGDKYDSLAELYFKNKLVEFGIPYKRQVPFTFGGAVGKTQKILLFQDGGCRVVTYKADFVISIKGIDFIIDVKGKKTQEFQNKRNLLMWDLHQKGLSNTTVFKCVPVDKNYEAIDAYIIYLYRLMK